MPQGKLVYLAYSYAQGIPPYVSQLKPDLKKEGFLLFHPLEAVEQQYDEDQKEALLALTSKVPSAICRFLKIPESLQTPLSDAKIVQALRQGDAKTDVDTMLFKELFFLVRSSVVLCDLVVEPYGCELLQKLFYAKLMDIPVVGIAPGGRSVNPFVQKYLKVVLTDDFNSGNVLPLLRAYGG